MSAIKEIRTSYTDDDMARIEYLMTFRDLEEEMTLLEKVMFLFFESNELNFLLHLVIYIPSIQGY